jgi:hypothetical protein
MRLRVRTPTAIGTKERGGGAGCCAGACPRSRDTAALGLKRVCVALGGPL